MLFHIKIDATEKNGVFKYSYQALLGGFLRCSRTDLIPFFAISATSSYRTIFFSRFYAETMQHIPQKRPPGRYIQTLALAAALALATSTPLTEAGRKTQRALYLYNLARIYFNVEMNSIIIVSTFSWEKAEAGIILHLSRQWLRLHKGGWK